MKPRANKNLGKRRLLSIFSGDVFLRKKLLLGILFTLIVMIIVTFGIGYHGAGSTPANVPRYAIVTSFEGSVMIQAAGEAVALPAQENMDLKAGDLIITGVASGAVILFDDGSISRIDSNSRVEIESLHRIGDDGPDVISIKGSLGAIWNNVKDVIRRNSRFEVNTPQAVAGVRGTLFVAKTADNGETLFRVYEGMIGVSSYDPDDEFIVAAFQQAVFSPGIPAPTGPEPIDFSTVDDFELLCLMEDSLHVFIALLELAAELGELEFLERVQDLLSSEKAATILGTNLAYVQELLADLLQAESDSDPETEPDSEPEPESEPDLNATLPEPDFSLPVIDFPLPGPTPEPDPETFTVTINEADGGTVSGDGGVYETGTELTFTAEPNPEFYFVEWQNNGVFYSYYNPLELTVDSDYEVTPVFTNITFDIAINDGDGGIVMINYFVDGQPAEGFAGAYALPSGTVITVTAIPTADFNFVEWQNNGSSFSPDNPLPLIVDDDYTLTPTFIPQP